MALMLPTDFEGVSIEPTLITARNELVPAFGGPMQRRNRMGARYQLRVKIEPLEIEDAYEWADIDAESEVCVFAIPQPGLETGTPGLPRVRGAGQAGANIVLDGLTPSYAVRKNQWLTIVTAGQRYCYRSRSDVIASATGVLTLPLRTMLRVPPADNDVILLGQPEMEGFCTPDEGCWAIDGNHLIAPGFTIKERE